MLAVLVVTRQVSRSEAFAAAIAYYLANGRVPLEYRGFASLANALCRCMQRPICPLTKLASCSKIGSDAVKRREDNVLKVHSLRLSSLSNDFALFSAVLLLVLLVVAWAVAAGALLIEGVSLGSLLPIPLCLAVIVLVAMNIDRCHRGRYSYERYYYAWLHAVHCSPLQSIAVHCRRCQTSSRRTQSCDMGSIAFVLGQNRRGMPPLGLLGRGTPTFSAPPSGPGRISALGGLGQAISRQEG